MSGSSLVKPRPGGLSDNEKVFVEALAGAIGGFAGAVAFYPLDTIKTRIQVRYDDVCVS
jgi:hypothetical protein